MAARKPDIGQSFWMMKAGHLASFYGIASTRKALLADLAARGIPVPMRLKPVRVLVYEVKRGKLELSGQPHGRGV